MRALSALDPGKVAGALHVHCLILLSKISCPLGGIHSIAEVLMIGESLLRVYRLIQSFFQP
jgi:hypothetical protein